MKFGPMEVYLRGVSISCDKALYSLYSLFGIRLKILDHPRGYRKLALKWKKTREATFYAQNTLLYFQSLLTSCPCPS